jgi:hypothetical protein
MLSYMEEYISYWHNLKLQDLFGIIFLLIMVLVILASNMLFRSFVESKPAGRKTVLGKYFDNVTLIIT